MESVRPDENVHKASIVSFVPFVTYSFNDAALRLYRGWHHMMGQPWPAQYTEDNPKYYTSRYIGQLNDLVNEMRKDERNLEDPKARALVETCAEVLSCLKNAYEDYDAGIEAAWR
jgi:hypothetical protein